ncbi:MAG: hypothetical protein M1826_000906 [Phylliscum demangeonii]|nr:MAG: hypothetical protein M1826_000906 [Phylliscum demangeonii]
MFSRGRQRYYLLVLATAQLVPGNLSRLAARAQAECETVVTDQNESFVRSFHPSLEACATVWVHEDVHGPQLWLVPVSDYRHLLHTHAGGREIHFSPSYVSQPTWAPVVPFREDPISRRIDGRRMLTPDDLHTLRCFFPGSIGIRVLIAGWVIVLFENRRAMVACWGLGAVSTVSGRRIGYQIAVFHATSAAVASDDAVSPRPNDLSPNHACLGLRLRMPSGESVITTTTHAFVKLASRNQSWLRRRVVDWVVRAKESLARSRALRAPASTPAVAESCDGTKDSNRSLGTVVWLAGTNRKLGTITTTYDPHPSRLLPFPSGFTHDLSLITGETLPLLTSPPGMPSISGWGSYPAALDGGPLFVCRLNAVTGRGTELQGRGISTVARQAIALSCDYTWDRQAFSQNASILWRTNYDPNRASGFSGSVLCLGRLADPTALAIVFQNYESPLKAMHTADDIRDASDPRATFKGGFILPPEVRLATIEAAWDFESQPLPHTLTAAKRTSGDDGQRRSVTGP